LLSSPRLGGTVTAWAVIPVFPVILVTSRNQAIINRLNSFELQPIEVTTIVETVKKEIPKVYIDLLPNIVDSYARLEQYRLWSPTNQNPSLSYEASQLISYLDLLQDIEDCNEQDCIPVLIAAGIFAAVTWFGAAYIASQFLLPAATETLTIESVRIAYRMFNAGEADEIVEWALTDGISIYETFTTPVPAGMPAVASYDMPVLPALLGTQVTITCSSDNEASSSIFGGYKLTWVPAD